MLHSRGATTTTVACDVREMASIERLYETVTDEVGEVDVLVNSAGSVTKEPITSMAMSDWKLDIDTNLTGVFRACQVFGRH